MIWTAANYIFRLTLRLIFSKEQLELALRKKRECNGKALKIVEELIEQRIDHGSFIEKVHNFDVIFVNW